MRKFLIAFFLIVPIAIFAQKPIDLKKKFYGGYKGTIPSYKIDTGTEVVEVGACEIFIEINANDINLAIGKNNLHGTYRVMFEAKSYYLLDVKVDEQLATERIMVYKRGRKLSRDGMYPQPVAELSKYH